MPIKRKKMKEVKEHIHYDSPEAAQPITVTAWKTPQGTIYLDERAARYSGCTHHACECGKDAEKNYIMCPECRQKATVERWQKMPAKEWDGSEPVTIFNGDEYFFSEDDLIEYCEDHDCKPEDLMLVFCEENHYGSIDAGYWEDVIPEEGDIPKALEQKLDEFNDFIKTLPAASYSPAKVRVTLKTSNL